MFKFNLNYCCLAVLLFFIEVFIGAYMHDAIIRPFGGDFMVVILIYCFVKGFVDTPVLPTIISVLLFAYTVEISQYFHLVYRLGLGHSTAARIIMGTSFSWIDMLIYSLGMLLVLLIEQWRIAR